MGRLIHIEIVRALRQFYPWDLVKWNAGRRLTSRIDPLPDRLPESLIEWLPCIQWGNPLSALSGRFEWVEIKKSLFLTELKVPRALRDMQRNQIDGVLRKSTLIIFLA